MSDSDLLLLTWLFGYLSWELTYLFTVVQFYGQVFKR